MSSHKLFLQYFNPGNNWVGYFNMKPVGGRVFHKISDEIEKDEF